MFAIWACKQVMGVAGTNIFQSKYKRDHDLKCPSCGEIDESCGHILACTEVGRVDALNQSMTLLDGWMKKVGTGTALRKSIIPFAKGRGGYR